MKKNINESEYTDFDIDRQMERDFIYNDDDEWMRRNGSWDDKMKFELGLIRRPGEVAKYPSTTDGLNRIASRAQKLLDYYTDPKRAATNSCVLRARALKKILKNCEDRITNPGSYIEKQRGEAEREYDKRTSQLRQSDTERILKTYAYPKDRVEPSDDEYDTMNDFRSKSWFPGNFDEDEPIQLSEANLRYMVSESVKRLLNEIDWKTYYNAMNKAKERGDKRARMFGDAAQNEFGQKYSFVAPREYKGEDDYEDDYWDEYVNYYPDFTGKNPGTRYMDKRYVQSMDDPFNGDYDVNHLRFDGNKYHTGENVFYDDMSSTERPDAFDRRLRPADLELAKSGDEEFGAFMNGKYDFDPQKGWYRK